MCTLLLYCIQGKPTSIFTVFKVLYKLMPAYFFYALYVSRPAMDVHFFLAT